MKVWRKNSVKWTLNGKRVSPNMKGARKKTIPSKRFYGTLTTFEGKRKQIPLTEDANTSRQLLRRLQAEEDHKRAMGVTRQDVERQRPLVELIAEYEEYLLAKGDTKKHVRYTLYCIRGLAHATKAKTVDDLDATRIASTLARWRGCPKQNISPSTSNHYTTAIKTFTRWLWIEKLTVDDTLRNLRKVNAAVDLRRIRRALTPTEIQRLIEATKASRKRLRGLKAEDRAMLYLVAAYTGLRASELASLSRSSFDLEAATVTVEAAYSKRRRTDTLPLHVSLIEPLREYLSTKTGRVFGGTWAQHSGANCAGMMRYDLKRAGIAYVDDQGRYADFHALRHTFISQLARSGVHPLKAKELARHSTITLTMDVYSHVSTEELREALDSLPSLGPVSVQGRIR